MLSHRPWKSVSRLQPHWLKSLRPFQFCFKINEIILEYESTFENISLRVSFLEQTDKSEAESEMLDKDSSISWRAYVHTRRIPVNVAVSIFVHKAQKYIGHKV